MTYEIRYDSPLVYSSNLYDGYTYIGGLNMLPYEYERMQNTFQQNKYGSNEYNIITCSLQINIKVI